MVRMVVLLEATSMNPAQPSTIELFLPFLIMLVIFYFLIIRPQGRKLKEHDKFLSNLKRGDAVITASGILGTIDGMTDAIVTLEVANGVKIKFLRKQIAGSQASLERTSESKK